MQRSKVLHIMHAEKFIEPFYRFTKENFAKDFNRHIFYIKKGKSSHAEPIGSNVLHAEKIGKLGRYIVLMRHMYSSEKIILHGLFDYQALMMLFFNPWLLKKCYWVIWGGDLYTYKLSKRSLGWWKKELFRRFVIKRIGHFITHIEGDYRLAQQWYGVKGEWHECFMYPSNLYQEAPSQLQSHDGINILLGNSADPSNNHIEVLDKLKNHANENLKIYCPLSYGNQVYAKEISKYGKSLFGEKFIALLDFMPLEKYTELLAIIDIAIFNHNRQQGMGNTTSLLGMRKKVFIREEVTPYMMFKNIGIKVYPINNLDLNLIDADVAQANCVAVKNYFSNARLKEQWGVIYE